MATPRVSKKVPTDLTVSHRPLPTVSTEDWQALQGLRQHPPQAVLVHGQPFRRVADLLLNHAAVELCETPLDARQDGKPCGRCPACQWTADHQHPDLLSLYPASLQEDILGSVDETAADDGEEGDKTSKSKEIKIEQVRGIATLAERSSHRGGRRFVLLGPAESLNTPAANALLKTLEEPQPGLVFLLASERLRGIPPTLLSRCRRVRLQPAAAGAASLALPTEMAGLVAKLRRLPADPLALAEEASNLVGTQKAPLTMGHLIDGLQRWAAATLEASLSGNGAGVTVAPMRGERAQQRLANVLQELAQARRSADHPLNPRLTLESLMTKLAKALNS